MDKANSWLLWSLASWWVGDAVTLLDRNLLYLTFDTHLTTAHPYPIASMKVEPQHAPLAPSTESSEDQGVPAF